MLQIEYLDPPALVGPNGILLWDDEDEFPLPPELPEGEDRAPADLTTHEKVARAEYGIHRLFEAGNPVVVAYSSGKDSSVLLALVLDAARSFKEAGGALPPILVTHANTSIENPAFQIVATAEIEKIRRFAATHDLPVRVDVVQPALNDSWAVRIISGRALPTFANSSARDCTINWKIKPQERQRKLALAELAANGEPVVLVGTRYEESSGRAARMSDRGETDLEIWQQEIRDKKTGKLKRTENRLSPIAHWTQEDVWVYLRELMDGERRENYTDAKQLWEVYQDGGNSTCAVVADDTMKASAKACGARFGCSLCVISRDKSLENMLEADPKYDYLRNLNKLQRFIYETRDDWSRRQWMGRSIDSEGFIAIEPDSYSSEMTADLLAMALTIQRDEELEAHRLGIAPRFRLVSAPQLIAIDATWSLQAYQARPFEAIRIYHRIYREGESVYPPEVDGSQFKDKKPSTRYLHVGSNWEDADQLREFTGLRSIVGEMVGLTGETAGGCVGTRFTADGRTIMDMEVSDFFDVDPEGAGMFFDYEADRVIEEHASSPVTRAYQYYVQLGVISTSERHASTIDYMMRRSTWKLRHGVTYAARDELMAYTVSPAERRAGLKAPPGQQTLHERYEVEMEQRHAARCRPR
jgi:3'-phosphoadenosine 5'-phosphosulfate sulfotransferase (PAPS reductase)/FAD synthetase